MSGRADSLSSVRGRAQRRAAGAERAGFPAAMFDPAFARWISRASALDFLDLLREFCAGRGTGRHADSRAPARSRWVQRDGCVVRFTHGAVPGRDRIHVHRLPSPRVAEQFALALLRTAESGGAAPLDPEEWAGWQQEEGGHVSTPSIALQAIRLSDRRTG